MAFLLRNKRIGTRKFATILLIVQISFVHATCAREFYCNKIWTTSLTEYLGNIQNLEDYPSEQQLAQEIDCRPPTVGT